MAEIKIEKKAPVWPWIVAAIIIIGLLLYFFVWRDDGTRGDRMQGAPATTEQPADAERRTTRTTTDRGTTGAVGEYVNYVNETRDMGLDHEYTSGALTRLEEAVRAKAAELKYDVQADIDRIDDHAGHITDDPHETSHANHIRAAADALSTAMQNMQQEHYPDLSGKAQEVRQAASNIDPNTLTLEQRDAVKGFFDRSADLLQNMQ